MWFTKRLMLTGATLLASGVLALPAAAVTDSYAYKKSVSFSFPFSIDIQAKSRFIAAYELEALSKGGEDLVHGFDLKSPAFGAAVSGSSLAAFIGTGSTSVAGQRVQLAVDVSGVASTDNPDGISARSVSTSTLTAAISQLEGPVYVKVADLKVSLQGDTTKPEATRITKDPVYFNFTNDRTGEVYGGNVFDSGAVLSKGAGSIAFEDGVLLILGTDQLDGQFYIDMSNQWSTGGGRLNLAFKNGVVTQSEAAGWFAGLLPEVGMSAIGAFNIGTLPILTLDFGLPVGDTYSGNIGSVVDGQAAVAVPEPAAWLQAMAGLFVMFVGSKRMGNSTAPLRSRQ